ncbi:MAG TPA: proton-conducting transporter membrane subunit [Candidatus Limnocylindria bacterium]|nr:proton-conducting transporter membrane subunit [Candidatus Limnocylindria bacterium]
MSTADIAAASAAVVLAAGAAGVALVSVILRVPSRTTEWLGALVCAGAAVTAIASGAGGAGPGTALARGPATTFFATLVSSVMAVALALAAADPRRRRRLGGAVPLLLASSAGAALLVVANDVVALFVALALVSLPLYVVTARSGGAQPLRHLLLGATATAVAVYGIALLYAATGETGYEALARATHNPLYLGGLGLVSAGLLLHVALAPGSRWSVAARVAVLAALLRFVVATRSGEARLDWEVSLAAIAACAILLAAIAGLTERRLGRLLAYATITQAAFVVTAAAASAPAAATFAVVVYATLAVGAFGTVALLQRDDPALRELAGLARRRPLLAVALAVFVFGLIGLPPTGGFYAKLVVFEAAIRARLLWLVMLGALATVVSAAAYLRIVLACFAAPPIDSIAPPRGRIASGILLVLAAAVVALGVVPGPLLDAAQAIRF